MLYYYCKMREGKKKKKRYRHILTNIFHRIVHVKREVWRAIVFSFSLTKMLLFFFPSKFKSGTQRLNNGDGLSEYVGQSLWRKNLGRWVDLCYIIFLLKVHFWLQRLGLFHFYLKCFKSFVLMFGFSFIKEKLFIRHPHRLSD